MRGGCEEHDPVTYAFLAVLVLAAFVFSRLETRVDAGGIHWFFGAGFPGGSISWHEVTKVEPTEIGFLEGWPIHWTFGHGWLWYSGGYHAVEFYRTHGGPVTVGTDDPQGLFEAVERFRQGAA